jgi:hypothetical protein
MKKVTRSLYSLAITLLFIAFSSLSYAQETPVSNFMVNGQVLPDNADFIEYILEFQLTDFVDVKTISLAAQIEGGSSEQLNEHYNIIQEGEDWFFQNDKVKLGIGLPTAVLMLPIRIDKGQGTVKQFTLHVQTHSGRTYTDASIKL